MEVTPKNDINGHISQEILSQLVQKESFVLKSLNLANHLKKCQRCHEIVSIKNHLQKIAGGTKPTESKSHPQRSDLHDSISRIYDSSLTKQEAADFLHHISSCSQCFEYVGFVLEDSLTPIPEEIEEQIAALTDISLAEMVLNEVPPQESIFQKILSKIKKSVDMIKEGGFVPVPEPRPGTSLAMRIALPVSFVAVIAFAIFLIPTEPSAYVYDDKVPFEYDKITFRGAGTMDGDPEIRKFNNRFASAISDYILFDYEKFVMRMTNLEPIALDIKTKALEKEHLATIRDFYFYLGVSHFALSRSEIRSLSEDQKKDHNYKAIRNLIEATSLASANNLDMPNRDTYFLGLAYGFGGHPDSAASRLGEITNESQYYEKSRDFLPKWQKK